MAQKSTWKRFTQWLKGEDVAREVAQVQVVGEKEYLHAVRSLVILHGTNPLVEEFFNKGSREAFVAAKACLEYGLYYYDTADYGQTWLELNETKRDHIEHCSLCQKLFGSMGACPDV